MCRECVQSDEQRQRPELKKYCGDGATIDDFAEVAEDQESDNAQNGRRYTEQIRFGGAETQVTKGECQIGLWRRDRNWTNRSASIE